MNKEECNKRLHSGDFYVSALYQSKAGQYWPAKFVFCLTKYLIKNNPMINIQSKTEAKQVKLKKKNIINTNKKKKAKYKK